jgi:hypothetical protein
MLAVDAEREKVVDVVTLVAVIVLFEAARIFQPLSPTVEAVLSCPPYP